MKKLLFIVVFGAVTQIFANHTFEPSITCKECHPKIYEEFQTSQHRNASIFRDEIHAAVWKKHPKNIKLQSYGCARCHTPASKNFEALIAKKNGVVPDPKDETQQEGVSCAYCHRIEGIEHGDMLNKNIIAKEAKAYFGTRKDHIKSPFHKIRTDSEHFNNGNVCIGCHSHKKNKFGMNVCSTNIKNELDGANCVSCHMPKVDGTVSVLTKRKQHTFHGFPGTHTHLNMLSKYVDIELLNGISAFDIAINNKSSHALSLHPMRVMQLRLKVIRDGETKTFEPKNFLRAIGADGKPTPPWLAKEIVKDTSVKANEKRVIHYDYKLQKGDKVEATIGYFLVNPKIRKNLDLDKSEVATKFHVLKTQSFTIQ